MSSAVADDIRRVFRLQTAYKWEAKSSSLERRKNKLRRLRAEVLARAGAIQAALAVDLGKPGGEPYSPEVESTVRAIDEVLVHLDVWAEPLRLQPSEGFEGTQPTIN